MPDDGRGQHVRDWYREVFLVIALQLKPQQIGVYKDSFRNDMSVHFVASIFDSSSQPRGVVYVLEPDLRLEALDDIAAEVEERFLRVRDGHTEGVPFTLDCHNVPWFFAPPGQIIDIVTGFGIKLGDRS